MNKIIISLVFLLAPLLYSQDVKTVNLDDCIKIALENNKALEISKSRILSAEERYNEVRTAELPVLRFNGSYTRLSPVDPFKIGSQQISPSILNNYSMKLSLTQPLFTGFRLSSNTDISEMNYRSANMDFEKERVQLVYDVKSSYLTYIKARELKRVIENNINEVRLRLRDLENLYNSGLATSNEVLKVKVQLSNFEMLLLEAANNMDVAVLALNNLMGIPVGTKLDIRSVPFEYKPVSVPSAEELIKMAMQNRSELRSLEYRYRAGEYGIKMSKSGWYPQVNLSANYYYSNPNTRIFPQQDKFKGTWDIGLTLSYDLWNWRLYSYQTAQAEASVEQTKFLIEQVSNAIEFEVRQAYKNLQTIEERIKLSSETVLQAQEN